MSNERIVVSEEHTLWINLPRVWLKSVVLRHSASVELNATLALRLSRVQHYTVPDCTCGRNVNIACVLVLILSPCTQCVVEPRGARCAYRCSFRTHLRLHKERSAPLSYPGRPRVLKLRPRTSAASARRTPRPLHPHRRHTTASCPLQHQNSNQTEWSHFNLLLRPTESAEASTLDLPRLGSPYSSSSASYNGVLPSGTPHKQSNWTTSN